MNPRPMGARDAGNARKRHTPGHTSNLVAGSVRIGRDAPARPPVRCLPRTGRRSPSVSSVPPVLAMSRRPSFEQREGVTGDYVPAPVSPPVPTRRMGGFTRRRRPTSGLRPTVRFAIAAPLTAAWVGFSVWVSTPWRDDLEDALGPVMAWVIPIFLAYIPGLVIGFMMCDASREPVPGARARASARAVARGPVAGGDRRDRGLERGAGDRSDARTDRRSDIRGPGGGRAGRQQLDRPYRRASGGSCETPRA